MEGIDNLLKNVVARKAARNMMRFGGVSGTKASSPALIPFNVIITDTADLLQLISNEYQRKIGSEKRLRAEQQTIKKVV